MKIFAVLALLLATTVAQASDAIRYNTIIRIASSGESIDFDRLQHARPILQLSYHGGRTLPEGASIVIHASPSPVILVPDALGAVEWPMDSALRQSNPAVTSTPSDLSAAGHLRVATDPSQSIDGDTVRQMLGEYRTVVRQLSFFKRLMAPRPKAILIIGHEPLRATSDGQSFTAKNGRIIIPLVAAVQGIRLSGPPQLVLLDLGLE